MYLDIEFNAPLESDHYLRKYLTLNGAALANPWVYLFTTITIIGIIEVSKFSSFNL